MQRCHTIRISVQMENGKMPLLQTKDVNKKSYM